LNPSDFTFLKKIPMQKQIMLLLAIFATCTLGFGQNPTRTDLKYLREAHPNHTVLLNAEQHPVLVPIKFHYSIPLNATRLAPKVSTSTYEKLAVSAGKTLLQGAKSLKKGRYALVGVVVVWLCATAE